MIALRCRANSAIRDFLKISGRIEEVRGPVATPPTVDEWITPRYRESGRDRPREQQCSDQPAFVIRFAVKAANHRLFMITLLVGSY